MLVKAGLIEGATAFRFSYRLMLRHSREENMAKKIWEITDKGLNLALEYRERKNVGGEFREFMKVDYSPILESGKTIKEEEENE